MVSDSEPELVTQIETLYEQDFYSLRDECLHNNFMFEDPEFLPREEFLRERTKEYEDIVWLRPHDICRPDEPILVSNKNEGFDVKQGLDSWFVPAFSAIADSTALLNHVIPPDQGFTKHENYCGIFHFRFWFGRWIEIVIDDLLPTRKGCLVYMKSNSLVEFWPALLEKAYAKAKGTYQLLNSWLPIDACIELTGGCPERVKRISSLLSGDKRQVDRLFMDILRANQNGNIVVVSFLHAESNPELNEEARQLGLEPRYVYRVTQVADLGQGRQIVRVKNCSGWTEPMWCGSWAPDDTNWANVSDAIRRELDGEAFHDGGFWIGFQDFLKYFDTIDFCHINHEVDKEVVFNGRWEVGLNAGGVQKGDFKNYAKNPQCFIELRSPNPQDPERLCSAVISLMQRRRPASKVKGVNKVGFRIYRVDKEADELTSQFFSYRRNDGRHKAVTKTPTWQDGRESNLRIRLPVGKYCIIPSTFDTDQEGDFILRVHIEQFGPEEESDSDSDTLIETRALIDRSQSQLSGLGRATPQYGSSAGQGNQLYGRTGERSDRATPLYGSRLQLEHVREHSGSEISDRGRKH